MDPVTVGIGAAALGYVLGAEDDEVETRKVPQKKQKCLSSVKLTYGSAVATKDGIELNIKKRPLQKLSGTYKWSAVPTALVAIRVIYDANNPKASYAADRLLHAAMAKLGGRSTMAVTLAQSILDLSANDKKFHNDLRELKRWARDLQDVCPKKKVAKRIKRLRKMTGERAGRWLVRKIGQ